jgi:hypothetical protein
LRPKLIEAGIEAAEKVAEVMKNAFDLNREKLTKLIISGRDRRNGARYGNLQVSVKITSGLEAAVTEAVNKMDQEQLEAKHELFIYAPRGKLELGFGRSANFKNGL